MIQTGRQARAHIKSSIVRFIGLSSKHCMAERQYVYICSIFGLFPADICGKLTFIKYNGKTFCGFFLQPGLTWQEANERCDLLGGRLPVVSSVKENTDIFHSVVGPEAEVCFSSLLSLSTFKFVDPPPSRYSQGWVGGAVLELRQIRQKIFG